MFQVDKSCILVFFSFCCLFTHSVIAQRFDAVKVSLKAGALYSGINDLNTTILNEPFFLNYELNSKKKFGYTGGLGVNWEIKNSITAISLDVMYAFQGSDLEFSNHNNDFNYKMQFNYQYLNIPILFKVYPLIKRHEGLSKLNLGVGPQIGINISPTNIIYTSSGKGKVADFGTDLQQQQQLRNVLKGNHNFGVNFHLGYDCRKAGLNFELQYHLGLTDIVSTGANAYNFIENKNTTNTFQFTLGWEIFSTYYKKHVWIKRNPNS